MNDLNFFSILKKQKQKNKSIQIVGFSLLAFFILANAGLVGFGLLAMNRVEKQINNNKAYIASPVTRQKVKDADILNKETAIAANYLNLAKQLTSQFKATNQIKVELINHIRGLAPQTTRFVNANYSGLMIDLDCATTDQKDPIYFYHQLLQDARFKNVRLPQIVAEENKIYSYTISVELKGEELK